jgi:hypothetical protein
MRPRRSAIAIGTVALVAILVALAGLAGMIPGAVGQPRVPHYVDETTSSGVDHTYDGEFRFAVGGGVATFDCNGDALPDLYVAGGARPAALFRNAGDVGGSLRFARVEDATSAMTGVNGAYPVDIDGDGIVDLAVLRIGGNVLLRGLGDCRFERANERWGVDGGAAVTEAFAATWEGTATLPTLAFGNYVNPARTDVRRQCDDNALLRPDVAGSRYAAPLPLSPSWCALSMLFSDWDRSGRRDLRISNDRHYYRSEDGAEQLWRMEAGAPPSLYGEADGWQVVQVEGMGIASYDLTGDGYPEVYLTSQGANRLQELTSGVSRPTYGDIGLKRGVNATRPFTGGDDRPSTAWHDDFQDVNDDGLVDLFVSKGNVTDDPSFATRDPSNLLLGRADGTFVEAADRAGIVSMDRGRGAAVVDLNLDGLLDLVLVNYGAPVRVWRNAGAGDASGTRPLGNWLEVRLRQDAPNRDAIGSWIELTADGRTQRREVTVGGGHAGGSLGWIHFGLGDARGASIRVQWPDGQWGPVIELAANGFSVIDRDAGVSPFQAGG